VIQHLLLVENETNDIRFAGDLARSIGIAEVVNRPTLRGAMDYLEIGLKGEGPLPEGIVLDLDLGYDSGYELLRFWHSTPKLSQIPLIVWSVLGDEQRGMCNLFGVNRYVAKWEGAAALREALEAFDSPAA